MGSSNEVRPFPSAPVPVGERWASLLFRLSPLAGRRPRSVALGRANDTAARWNLFPMMVSHVILRPGRNCFFRPHPAWAAQLGGPVSAPRRVRRPFRPSRSSFVSCPNYSHVGKTNESDSLLFGPPWSRENFLGNQACTSPIRLQVRTTTVSYEDFDQDT